MKDNAPLWFIRNKNILRQVILTLLIVSMLGPWFFDVVSVPGEYPCNEPFIRLDGNLCGDPTSGFFLFYIFIGGLFYNLAAVVSGTFTGQAREFLMGLFLLPIIPFFTTLPFIWKKETLRLRTVNLVAWILALLITLFIFSDSLSQNGRLILHLWGLWLYIITAIGAVILEISLLKANAEDERASVPPV